jgi:tetratricopeptide (TPR) repeat protein
MRYLIVLLAFLSLSFNLASQNVPNLTALGNQAMNNGQFRNAQQYYQTAIQKEPQNWDLYTLLGFSIHKQKKFNYADSIYAIAVKNDSNSSKAHWYKGMNHIAMRQDSSAIWHYKKFIDLEKIRGGSLIQAYRSIGQSYERMLKNDGLYSWQIDDMIYHYEQIELADPSYVEVPLIRNFIEVVQNRRPANQVGKWIMTP